MSVHNLNKLGKSGMKKFYDDLIIIIYSVIVTNSYESMLHKQKENKNGATRNENICQKERNK